MSVKKSEFLSAFGKAFEIFKALVDAVKELGGSDEHLARILTSKSLCKDIAELIVGAKQFALKYLALVKDGIAINASIFDTSRFTKGPVKYYIWDNFRNWILNMAPDQIPAFQGTLTKFMLTKSMNDAEIRSEIGDGTYSVSEVLATIAALTERQPKGEDGDLLTNGYANIFYVKLNDACVVAVGVGWDSGDREWHCDASGLGGGRWAGGSCVFSRG